MKRWLLFLLPLAVFCQSIPDDDVVLRAMRDEMDRSRQLRVVAGGADDVPYFISYSLSDAESFHVTASLGAAVNVARTHSRAPVIEVRVGGYDFDNTGHIFSGIYSGSRFDGQWPLDDYYPSLRECFWLATDHAYKGALESMARKRAALNSASAPTDKLADFAHADPVKSIAKITRQKIDAAAWQTRVVNLSSVFNAYPEVLASGVDLEAIDGVTWLMNNEGTILRYPDRIAFLEARAEGQASDGMVLREAVSFQTIDTEKLASEAEMRKAITAVAENIRALTKAPVGEAFSGPVLFEPQAAAQLLAQLLGDNLHVPRKPLAEPGRSVNYLPSELETKVGSRILPDWMSVTDDPTQTVWNGKLLAGHEQFDLEGVAEKPVSLIEKGVLKGFVTTRQPIKNFPDSNGHARMPGAYGSYSAAITNLFVTAGQTTPLADLKKKLIDMCKQSGKPYGMLVRKLDFPFSGGAGELRLLAQASSQSGGSALPLSPPLLVYRVYADGREELVRGLRFRGVSTRSLRDILAASQETELFDYVNNAAPLAMMGFGGYQAPTAVVAPGLLFEEMEFEVAQDQLPKLPIVPPPTGN
jgi:TldD protein